jgi:hypothetical protein
MAGSEAEADDAGPESWPLLARAETSGMDNVGRGLTTVVARECLGMLGSRTARGDAVTRGAEQAVGLTAGGRAPAAARVRPAGGQE